MSFFPPMEGSIAKELYSESLQLSVSSAELVSKPITSGDLQDDDGPLWDVSDEELDRESDLDREWKRRHDQFHTIGYRDGVISGKEASAQEGFNIGFKQSVLAGYNWGVVRGVTSALACLPDALKERLIEEQGQRNKFQGFYETVHSVSTTDALKLFHDDVLRKKEEEQSEHAMASSDVSGMNKDSSGCRHLENYVGELQSLLLESPEIKSHLSVK
ncbi:protein YAE [Salix suchowensis]|nr:protein YAE [Salix suchowensis]